MRYGTRVWHAVLTWRHALIAASLAGWSILLVQRWSASRWMYTDWPVFQFVARILFHQPRYDPGPGGALHVYANLPRVQIGPPAIAASLPFDFLPYPFDIYGAVVMMAALGVVFVLIVERLGSVLRPGVDLRPAVLVGGLVFAPAWASIGALFMHLDDVVVLVALAAAMLQVARGRWIWVGVLLGTAVAAKPWALFLVPIVWGLVRERRASAVLVIIGVAGLWWSPFVLAAPDTIGSLGGVRLDIAATSGLRALGVHAQLAPGWLRGVQVPLAAAVGVLVAVRGRWIAAPLAAIAVRVALDAATYSYYYGGLVAAALLWDVARGRRFPTATVAAAVVGFGPGLLVDTSPLLASSLRLAGSAALVVAALWPRRPAVPIRVARTASTADLDRADDREDFDVYAQLVRGEPVRSGSRVPAPML